MKLRKLVLNDAVSISRILKLVNVMYIHVEYVSRFLIYRIHFAYLAYNDFIEECDLLIRVPILQSIRLTIFIIFAQTGFHFATASIITLLGIYFNINVRIHMLTSSFSIIYILTVNIK